MRRDYRGLVKAGLLALVGVGVMSAGAVAQTREKLSIRLDWTPWGVHAPFHLAQEKGWFRDAGLDVTIEDGNGSVTTVQIVGNGQFDVGHASLAPMAIARDKGLPVRAIAAFARKSDIGLIVPKEAGIRSPKDLAGKKLAFTAGSLEAPFIDALLAADGISRDKLELVNVDAAAKAGTYLAGRVDGAFSSAPFFVPVAMPTRPSTSLLFADYGLQFPSFGLFTTEAKIAERGPALTRFASVVAGSWAYVLNGHQDEAVRAIIHQRPQAKLDPAVLRGQIDALAAFFATPATAGKPVGFQAEEDWAAALKTLSEAQVIKPGGKPQDFYQNLLDETLYSRIAGG